MLLLLLYYYIIILLYYFIIYFFISLLPIILLILDFGCIDLLYVHTGWSKTQQIWLNLTSPSLKA